jgi:hypothetical protein
VTHRLLLLRHGELNALFAEGRHGGVVDLGQAGRHPLVLPAYVGESRWLMARAITSFRSAASVIPSKPKPK